MNDENALRIKAREVLRAGKLPHSKPKRMWGGQGSGACCALCSEAVGVEELGFELEFASEENGGDNQHLHLRCFAAWEFERRQFEPVALAVTNEAHHPGANGRDGHKQVSSASGVLSGSNNGGTICVQHEGTFSTHKRDGSSRGGAV